MVMQTSIDFRGEFKIVAIEPDDASVRSDAFRDLRQLALLNEWCYPGIGDWLDGKVREGLVSRRRVAFVGYLNGRPSASAVMKKGQSAKICHLWIDECIKGQYLGEMFMSLMALRTDTESQRIHLTLPESVWVESGAFFQSFGFETPTRSRRQYRSSEAEFACSASASEVRNAALLKLSRLSSLFSVQGSAAHPDLVLSLKPRWAWKILTGMKKVEVRRKFSTRWLGSRVLLYASAPVKAVVGLAKIREIQHSSPELLWSSFGAALGCQRNELEDYCHGCREVWAISLDEIRPFEHAVSLDVLRSFISPDLRPPQSYISVEVESPWAAAARIAAILKGYTVSPSKWSTRRRFT